MKKLKKLTMTLVALFAMTTGARADWTGGTYTATANESHLDEITVNADATLTINEGVTVTVTGGINVASGTLTVTGPGTLVVNGENGEHGGETGGVAISGNIIVQGGATVTATGGNGGSEGNDGMEGGNGGVAISGNIIVQGGATVTANGGNGGNGGNGSDEGGTGGNGGNAFAGTLTYKSGTVTANGGSGGSGGYCSDEQEYASSGSAGKAFANDVDFTQTTVEYTLTDGTSTIESVLNQIKVVISGGTEPEPPIEVTWDATTKQATFLMPVSDVELQVEYYPGMLTFAPNAIEGGTVEVVGLTGDALPAGFEKDAEGNIYVAQGTTFTVKATPEEGYHFVCWSDDDTNPEREITMPADGSDLSLTATFAENEYDITFSEGTNPDPENPEWTATPNPAKTKQTVTVTYSGSKKVIGVKAEKPGPKHALATVTTDITVEDGYTLTGTLGANVKISIAEGATVTLDGMTIDGENDGSYQWAGINCLGDATIILSGTNTVKGFHNAYPGIYVPKNKTLTIQGSGSLTASSNGLGCGIGGGNNIACGNIVIAGGTITANGGDGAAGIGSGDAGSCGNISITGGTITANGGMWAAGIGSGSGTSGSCGTVTITDGVTSVTATKGNQANYSIGAGNSGSCGTVTIGCTLDTDGNPVGGTTGQISTSPYTYQPSN